MFLSLYWFHYRIADHYKNQTAKLISAINYLSDFCSMSKIAIRIDDDVVFNPTLMINKVISYLKTSNITLQPNNESTLQLTSNPGSSNSINTKSNKNSDGIKLSPNSLHSNTSTDIIAHSDAKLTSVRENTVLCSVLRNRPIYRTHGHIYRVPMNTLPGYNYYPEFCAGFFIAFTSDLLFKFQKLIAVEPPFWIDDSYLGVLQDKLKTENIAVNKLLAFQTNGYLDRDVYVKLAVHMTARYYSESLGASKILNFSAA